MALTQVASGLIASVSGASLTGTQNIPKATLPTGSVLQVVQGNTNSNLSTTSSSFVASGFTLSITPSSASNKILVSLSGGQFRFTSSSSNGEGWVRLWRNIGGAGYASVGGLGSTDIQEILINYTNSTVAIPHSLIYLDSPATTSAITYQPYFKSANGQQVYYNLGSVITYITLMEISA
jgi:hypothetical protein